MSKALGASPGAARKIVFTADDAVEWGARGGKSYPCSSGNITRRYHRYEERSGDPTVRGMTLPVAAVVARGMGTCCVSGCGVITMDEANKKFTLGGKEFHEGDRHFSGWFYRCYL